MKEIRNTYQREEVLKAVKELKNHPTADEIYFKVCESHPSISKGTVYRNLNLLSELGLVNKIMMPGLEADRFDFRLDNHHHALCKKCKRVYDYDIDVRLMDNCSDFNVDKSYVVVTGICKNCKEK